MTITIVGLDGTIATTIARHLYRGSEPLVLVGRETGPARAVADELGDGVTADTLAAAAARSDTIVFATWFEVTKRLLAEHRSVLAHKVVVDVSNPITPPDENGHFQKVIGADESAGQILAGIVPDSTFVKAFGTLSAASLAAAAHGAPRRVLFFAADNATGAAEAERLITVAGFAPVSVGGVDQSIRIEVGGDLHEFGGLGGTVTVEQAHAALAG